MAERQSRQPLEKRKARNADVNAEQQVALLQARAEAANAKALALALLAADYAGKISAARQSYSGDELAAQLSSLMAEQRAAEKALSARLAGEAKERRGAISKAYRAQRKENWVKASFRPAAVEVTDRQNEVKAQQPRRAAGGMSAGPNNAGEIRTRIPPPADPALD